MTNSSKKEGTVEVREDLNPLGTSRVPVGEVYRPDRLGKGATLAAIAGAAAMAFFFALIAWMALKQTNLPAFGASMVTRALSSVTIAVVVVAAGVLAWMWVRDEHLNNSRWEFERHTLRPRWRFVLSYLVAYLSPAALVVATLAIPLSATKLYLDGVSVDQGFRTQFMTRMADEVSLSDMNYIDMPTYYPAGWFWVGGRLANLLGLSGWEVLQPWAIISLAMAASVLVPVWQRITGSLPVASGIALVSTAVMLAMHAEEPYAAIVALGIPAMAVLAPRIARGDTFALCGGIVYLGLSATFYTLFTATIALSVVAVSVIIAAGMQKSIKPIGRLLVLGVASIGIALVTWGPYLLAAVDGAEQSGDTATHYLPIEGTQFPVPFLIPSVLGVLCLVGLIYLVVRFRSSEVRSMWIAIGVFYFWMSLSMAITLIGNTLLGFRLDTVLVMMFATAGVLGIADFRLASVYQLYPKQVSESTARALNSIIIIIVVLGGIDYAQNLPEKNAHAIDLAYTDTDGNGERADRYPAGAARYYGEINQHLLDQGFEPSETIVLTDELDFMSFNPYRGFQAFTSHYANPLGEFGKRNETIESWAVQSWDQLSDPAAFEQALAEAPWQAPEVFIFRGSVDDLEAGWKYDLAEDLYPNNPNVRFRGVFFNPEVFSQNWEITQIGPFVVVSHNE
ncbi:galactan 5-O-arabinofuranosyltransferase [Corynebacterium callunae]|uniref:galactan 5-O-arabinofuranosyltransferase n=1 Tax=Corynebacterium callunae TaxID=1721 RepID=UPI003982154D